MSRCLGYSLQGRSGVCFGFCLGAHDDRIWRSSGVAAWKLADSSRTEAISQLGPPTRHARFSNVRSSAIGSPIDQRWSGPLSISNSGTLASWACCAAAASSFDAHRRANASWAVVYSYIHSLVSAQAAGDSAARSFSMFPGFPYSLPVNSFPGRIARRVGQTSPADHPFPALAQPCQFFDIWGVGGWAALATSACMTSALFLCRSRCSCI